MIKWLKREFFDWFAGFKNFIQGLDCCELCGNEQADSICVGCDKRICCMCDSGYYSDVELCTNCRANLTPEEEAQDREEEANSLKHDCTCPAACDLSEEEHAYITKYASKE
jgi:hypothetical protein